MNLIEEILKYKDIYYRYAYSISGNVEDAQDAIQEMYTIAYKDLHKLRDESKFYSWTMSILTNCARNIYKKNKKYSLCASYDHNLVAKELLVDLNMDIHHALNRLPLKTKECIVMKYYLGLSIDEIAIILKVPSGTVKSRIHNGIRKLRISMEVYYAYD